MVCLAQTGRRQWQRWWCSVLFFILFHSFTVNSQFYWWRFSKKRKLTKLGKCKLEAPWKIRTKQIWYENNTEVVIFVVFIFNFYVGRRLDTWNIYYFTFILILSNSFYILSWVDLAISVDLLVYTQSSHSAFDISIWHFA